MEPLSNFKPIIGDDLGYFSTKYSNVPRSLGFHGLSWPEDKPLSYAVKDKLIDFAERFYRDFEIIGKTYYDFSLNLQNDLDLNIDTLEKMLEVYNDDIAKPTQSRTIRRTYDTSDDTTGSTTSEDSSSINNDSVTTDYDIPLDNGTAQGVSKQESGSTTGAHSSNTVNNNQSMKKTGTETEEWSDVGVAPNYELLNGFLDNNRTMYAVFVDFFRNDFTLMEVYYG